jgi:hypothetical protein
VSTPNFLKMSPLEFLNSVVSEINSLNKDRLRLFTARDFVTVQRMNEIADAINGVAGMMILGHFDQREKVSFVFRRIEEAMSTLRGMKDSKVR